MADIASDHLFLRQCLLPELLRTVVVIVVHHGAAASMLIPAGASGTGPDISRCATPLRLFREVYFPVATILRLQVTLPLFFIADMSQPRQAGGINQVVTFAQQTDNRAAPDFFHGMFLKEEVAPDAMLNIQLAGPS